MNYLDDLIELYGRRPAAKVADDPKYDALCKAHDGNSLFHYARQRVERIREKLDLQVGKQETGQMQVKNALKLFEQLRVPDEKQEDEICRRLVLAAWYPFWRDVQKAHFDQTVKTLRKDLDYFLSFTQRNSVGGSNPVNAYHRYLIQSYGVDDPYTCPLNELAKAINRGLQASKYKLRGFFFPAHEDDSQNVSKKLQDAMDSALVFIQLVQNEMFSKDKKYKAEENYCFDEYNMAIDRHKHTIYLFVDGKHPDDMIPEEKTYSRFESWFQVIKATDCVALARTQALDLEEENVIKNQDLLRRKLFEKVQSFREALWNDSPPDLASQ